MRSLRLACALLALGLAACQSAPRVRSIVQEEDPKPPALDPATMERMMRYMAPGPEHAALAGHAGAWSVACKLIESPGAAPASFDGQAESAMVLGGRFLQERFQGQMMGQPFEGLLLMGFDKLDGQYFTIWMDTWGTGYSIARGRAPASGGALDLSGTMRDALTPQGRPFRHVERKAEDGHRVVELYDTLPDGTEWMVMSMDYRRE